MSKVCVTPSRRTKATKSPLLANNSTTSTPKAAAYITKLNGENETFEIEGDTLTAVIAYEAEIGHDAGDYWTAPCSWIERDTAKVVAVYNEDGDDTEATEWLKKMLN